MNSRLGEEFKHRITHAKTSTQDRNDRDPFTNLSSSELLRHRGRNRFRHSLQVTARFVTKVEGDFTENTAEVSGRSLRIAQDVHLVSDQGMGGGVQRHLGQGGLKNGRRKYDVGHT